MTAEPPDQKAQPVVLGLQITLLLEQCPQHLLQQGRVVRQGGGIDLHAAMITLASGLRIYLACG